MIINGDCLIKLKEIEDNSVDSIVTDPPYELGFMGKSWDNTGIANNKEMWAECLRVLKPGGHLLAFSGTRTYHRMAVAIEDAGFEVRDMIEWVYGSGFPKSHNIGKAVDKLQGNEREVIGKIAQPGSTNTRIAMGNGWQEEPDLTKGTSEWEGWGTALKPAHEPICMAQKPKDDKFILDACCGGKMFWFDKNHPNTLYVDKRTCEKGHNKAKPNHEVKPDMLMDFTDLQFPDKTFNMVVFDPPHLFLGENSKFAKDYGTLKNTNWEEDIKKGFSECFRVLKDYGTLIFKWNEFDIPVDKILSLTDVKPLFGQRSGKQARTHWISFMKMPEEQQQNITPNHEPICMARKPLAEKTVAENVLKYGTGGINIDESRVGTDKIMIRGGGNMTKDSEKTFFPSNEINEEHIGRFPANLIHDNSEEVREYFPNESERFFKSIIYTAKASKSERNKGCEELEEKQKVFNGKSDKPSEDMKDVEKRFTTLPKANNHPTVKPIALMEYLIKMVTPKGGIVLDPFAGSGSTLVAAKQNGFKYIGIEMTDEYIPIIEARLNAVEAKDDIQQQMF